jgi:FAD/FMN-containing dehydrogenase
VEARQLRGEFARARPDDGALSTVPAARYVMYAAAFTPTPELIGPVRAEVEDVKKAMAPWATGRLYLNFAETRADPATLWSEDAYPRLRRIKAQFDPHDLIRSNHPIPPAV